MNPHTLITAKDAKDIALISDPVRIPIEAKITVATAMKITGTTTPNTIGPAMRLLGLKPSVIKG